MRKTSRHIIVKFAVSRWTSTKYSVPNIVVIFRQTMWFAGGPMTPDEARELIVDGINYAAYKETESSLYDSDCFFPAWRIAAIDSFKALATSASPVNI